MRSASSGWPLRPAAAAFGSALDHVDHQRHAVEAVAVAHAVLQVVGVVARHARARVDLDRKARRARPDLGHVEELEAVAPLGRRLARLHGLAEEAVELGRGDPRRAAVGERDRVGEQARDVAPGGGRHRHHARALAKLLADARALVVEVELGRLVVPLVERDERCAAAAHREVGDAQVLGGDAVAGVADDERHVGALGGAL